MPGRVRDGGEHARCVIRAIGPALCAVGNSGSREPECAADGYAGADTVHHAVAGGNSFANSPEDGRPLIDRIRFTISSPGIGTGHFDFPAPVTGGDKSEFPRMDSGWGHRLERV